MCLPCCPSLCSPRRVRGSVVLYSFAGGRNTSCPRAKTERTATTQDGDQREAVSVCVHPSTPCVLPDRWPGVALLSRIAPPRVLEKKSSSRVCVLFRLWTADGVCSISVIFPVFPLALLPRRCAVDTLDSTRFELSALCTVASCGGGVP